MKYILILFFGSSALLYSQKLHHQMLGAQGTSTVLSNGAYVSQSIGQLCVIGTTTQEGKTYGQGFQQSVWSKYLTSTANNGITVVVYPNPTVSELHFQFSQSIKEPMAIDFFDVRGRLVFHQEPKAIDQVLTVDVQALASSNYLVRLSTSNTIYYSQILKQWQQRRNLQKHFI
jgi:hypothetical protein